MTRSEPLRPPSVGTVRAVVAATIVLTLFHFADNTIAIDSYPAPSWQPDWFVWVVPLSWLLFTAAGIAGYRAYRDGRFSRAHPLLFIYAYSGLVSLGHFLSGGPDELTTRGLASVLVDAVAGSAVLAVTIWSIVARRNAATAART
jgi:hypothetical protein